MNTVINNRRDHRCVLCEELGLLFKDNGATAARESRTRS